MIFSSVLLVEAATTNGPLAYVSLDSDMAYKTARKCAAGCVIYNGDMPCNAGSFKYDLGVFLGCGRCGQINACYCSAGLGSSATSYVSSCVSSACKGVDTWEDEVTSMLLLYNTYCATANVAPTTTTRPPLPGVTNTQSAGADGNSAAVTGSGPAAGASQTNAAGGATATGSAAAGDSTSAKEEKDKDGLSKSDVVALAASLGVGIPSLAIAALTLWIQLRKRRARDQEPISSNNNTSGSVNDSPEVQQAHVTQGGYNDNYQYEARPHVHEVGDSRGYNGRY